MHEQERECEQEEWVCEEEAKPAHLGLLVVRGWNVESDGKRAPFAACQSLEKSLSAWEEPAAAMARCAAGDHETCASL